MSSRQRSSWRIDLPSPPSWRGYAAIVRGWWTSWSRWALSLLDRDERVGLAPETAAAHLAQMATVPPDAGGPPRPPRGAEIARANEGAAIRAGQSARSGLRQAGITPPSRPPPAPPAPPTFPGQPPQVVVATVALDGIEAEALLRWADEGVRYIRAVPAERLRGLSARLSEIAREGIRWETLRDELREQLGVGERHLNLIARDQVAKLNGKITQSLQQAAGVEEYVWVATRDERTRKTHREAHGKTFRWDGPGAPGVGFYGTSAHPGQAGQCRCVARPVVPRSLFEP